MAYKKKILLVIAVLFSLTLSFIGVAYAGQQFSANKDSMKNSSVIGASIISNNGGGVPDLSGFDPGKKKNPGIGFDSLYGISSRDTIYTGEVPNIEDYKDKPKMSSAEIDSTTRNWYNDPKSVTEKLSWDNGNTNDIHAMNLLDQNINFMTTVIRMLGGFAIAIFMFFNAIFALLLKLFIAIGNFDVTFITKLDPIGISKNVRDVIIGDGSTISPILILATVIFMIGLVGLIAKYVTSGEAPARKIMQETMILILAFFLVAVSINGGWDKILEKTTQFSSTVITALNKDLGSKIKLFTYSTGNPGDDANNTMNGISAKTFIDVIIKQQFGVSVNELDLYGAGVDTQKLWGIDQATMQNIVKNVSSEANIATVSNGSEDNSATPNLGYMWYAASSGVKANDPFYVKDGKIYPNVVSKDRTLYVIDILSAIDAEAGGSPKAQAIMRSFKSPSSYWLEIFMCTIITIVETWAIALLAIISLASKLLFNAGFFFVPFFPIMLLIPKLRDTARKAINTWINSAVKMVLSQAMMIIIIFTSSSLCSYANFGSYFVDIVVLIFFGKYAPVILTRINDAVSANRDQLQFARRIDSRLSSAANSYSRKNMLDNINDAKTRKKELRDRLNNNAKNSDHPKDYTEDAKNSLGGLPDGGKFSNYGEGGIEFTDKDKEDYKDIVDNLADKNEEIDKISDADLAKQLGIDIDYNKLAEADEQLAKFSNIADERKKKSDKHRDIIEKALTSNAASVISGTRFGNYVVSNAWKISNETFNNADKRGNLRRLDATKKNSVNDKREELLSKKVNIGGKTVTVKKAIDTERENRKKEQKEQAKKQANSIIKNRMKIKRQEESDAKAADAYKVAESIRQAKEDVIDERRRKMKKPHKKKNKRNL